MVIATSQIEFEAARHLCDLSIAVRSTYLNGDWGTFMGYRIESETRRLYPSRERVELIEEREKTGLSMAA